MIWSACERLGIRPPGVKAEWDDNGPQTQANILEFHRIREFDESERLAAMISAGVPAAAAP